MKILVLGSNGQLGSDILRVKQTNYEMIGWQRADLDITHHDALKTKLLSEAFDILINCTSYHNTDQVEANAAHAFAINAFAVKEIAAICKMKQARFIHISTDYVFSHSKDNNLLNESCCPSPLNIYGASKLMGEALAQMIYDDVVIFRVASLFGLAGASGKGGNFVETMIRVGKERGKLRVVSDQIMSPTSTADMALTIVSAIEKNISPGIYHAVNTGKASWYEFAKSIIERTRVNAIVEPVPAMEYATVAMRPSFSALDNNKIAKIVGPIPAWEDALDRYLFEKRHV